MTLQPALSEETLRLLLAEQLGGAVQQLADQQEELLEELRAQPQVREAPRCGCTHVTCSRMAAQGPPESAGRP